MRKKEKERERKRKKEASNTFFFLKEKNVLLYRLRRSQAVGPRESMTEIGREVGRKIPKFVLAVLGSNLLKFVPLEVTFGSSPRERC